MIFIHQSVFKKLFFINNSLNHSCILLIITMRIISIIRLHKDSNNIMYMSNYTIKLTLKYQNHLLFSFRYLITCIKSVTD